MSKSVRSDPNFVLPPDKDLAIRLAILLAKPGTKAISAVWGGPARAWRIHRTMKDWAETLELSEEAMAWLSRELSAYTVQSRERDGAQLVLADNTDMVGLHLFRNGQAQTWSMIRSMSDRNKTQWFTHNFRWRPVRPRPVKN